ncbi:MAG: queuosine precursor transporter [Methanomicrobia archaeon]|nr:queuosine precursor transporter [Methanomicrobia archaeon]
MRLEDKKKIFETFFVTSLIISNITAVKIVSYGKLVFPAAVLAYAVTFLFTDVYSEIWGKKEANTLVRIGFLCNILALFLIRFSIILRPASFYDQSSFVNVLGGSSRIILASMTAYLISQHHDVWAFHFWRDKTKGKYLWIRNNASTMVSQLLDTSIFIFLAFYGNAPILTMIGSQYLIKLIIAAIDTPFCYIFVRWCRE